MYLISANVGPFKSINEPQDVKIDPEVTVLVGMNEAGKTIFLKALEQSNDALKTSFFDPVEDYPRKDLSAYLKVHKTKPSRVTNLIYSLTPSEISEINIAFHTKIDPSFTFSIIHYYDNKYHIGLSVDEGPVIEHLLSDENLSSDSQAAIKKAKSVRSIPDLLKDIGLSDYDKQFLVEINSRIAKTSWDSVVAHEIWEWCAPRVPSFLYFNDYSMLPSKMNLQDLAQRVTQVASDPKALEYKHRAVLALLRMADISITDFTSTGGYEPLKAKIEGVSISLTDQIMHFWKQNEELEVEVDIKTDSEDVAPFNNGPNLYLRIKNRRHRGVSTPFRQRSRGFIWFFSFLVWFDNVQHQIEGGKGQLILLLDEPGLALHALAQVEDRVTLARQKSVDIDPALFR